MKIRRLISRGAWTALALLAGCADHNPADLSNAASATTEPAVASAKAPAQAASGAQLWADNCSRCHNMRPPQSYNDAQWQAVVMHMRLRADLTGTEQREITRFLQASH